MKKTIFLALICALLLAGGTMALTALDAAGVYSYSGGAYHPEYTPEPVEPLFSEGLAAVCVDGRWGYASREGKLIVEPSYDAAGRFSYGLAPVRQDGRSFYIDVTGEEAIDASEYDTIHPFEDGYARVEKDGRTGFLNARGELAVPVLYEEALDASEGLIAAKLDGKWGYLTETGRSVIPFEYDAAEPFSGGAAYVESGGAGCLIDANGKILVSPVYSELRDGLALIRGESGWGFADADGETAVDCVWQDVELPSEGFFGVSVEGKWGFADYSGTEVIEAQWDYVWPFSGGVAMTGTRSADLTGVGSYGFIDRQGQAVGKRYRSARPFSGGYAAVSTDGTLWGYIDDRGRAVIEESFDYASDFSDGRALVGRDGAFYVVDETGAILSFYTEDSPSLLTTAAETTAAAREPDGREPRDLIRPVVLTLSGMLILFAAVSAILRTVNIRRRKRAHRRRYYDDEE